MSRVRGAGTRWGGRRRRPPAERGCRPRTRRRRARVRCRGQNLAGGPGAAASTSTGAPAEGARAGVEAGPDATRRRPAPGPAARPGSRTLRDNRSITRTTSRRGLRNASSSAGSATAPTPRTSHVVRFASSRSSFTPTTTAPAAAAACAAVSLAPAHASSVASKPTPSLRSSRTASVIREAMKPPSATSTTFCVFTPTTTAHALNSGPPLFPGLTAASCWILSAPDLHCPAPRSVYSRLITPAVHVGSNVALPDMRSDTPG